MRATAGRARRLLHRLSHRQRPGTEPVAVAELISPLRYDILVRERFLSRFANGDTEAEAVDSTEGREYRTWFESVVVPRFLPEMRGKPSAIDAAFEKRVRRSAELQRSFAASGYDRRRPIVLQAGRRLRPTSTGKLLKRAAFAGDGCHRLALLRLQGVTVLKPGDYLLERSMTLSPIDNTAMLIQPLGVSLLEYLAFLSTGFAPGERPDSAAELREAVSEQRPDRLAELDQVLEVDLPLLGAAL